MKKPAGKAKSAKARKVAASKPSKASAKSPKAAFYLKTHVSRFSTIVAVCDKDCLGKKFESNGLILDLETHRRFYEGEVVDEPAVISALSGAGNVNIVGEKSVELACRCLGVSKAGAKRIGGVSHLQVYRV
ncbi:MAG: DUF424 family protein [Candidatus Micrarchaeia archaeon]